LGLILCLVGVYGLIDLARGIGVFFFFSQRELRKEPILFL
jgi:hypothetical protein